LPQPAGTRKRIDGPRTDVSDLTTFVYYPIDNSVPGTLRGHLAAVSNPLGHVTRYENYDAFGNALRVVDPNEVATDSTFDHMGRSLTTTLRGVSGCDTTADSLCATDLTATRTYTPATGALASVTEANGNVTAYAYESRSRLASLFRGPSASDLRERMEYTYDGATGRKSMERYLGMESGSWVEKRRELFAYNTLSQLTTQTHGDATSIGYTYDETGAIATVRDENHVSANTRYVYDPARRLTHVYQTLGANEIATSYVYDLAGDVTSVTDPNGNVTTYRYDDFGRMLSQASPVTGVTSYTYDSAGDVISTTDANGATTARSYDALGRQLSASSSRAGLDTENVSYTYDEDACGLGNAAGRVSTMSDPTGETNYCYERRGLLTATSSSLTTHFSYDANGNRSSIVYPSGRTVAYTFDFANRPLSATAGGTSIVTSTTYLPFGPGTQFFFGNGTTKTMTFDARYRPLENKLVGPSGTIADYSYAEDAAGNITQIHDAVNATYNRDFGYDDLNRLTTAGSGTSLWGSGSYQYDAMGNMTSLHLGSRSLSFAYLGSTPKIQSVSGTNPETPAYDDAGNDHSMGAFNARNLMTGSGPVIYGSSGVEYLYDGRGVRAAAIWHGWMVAPLRDGLRYYVYSPELHLLGQTDWADNDEVFSGTEYIWFGDLPVAQASSTQPLRYNFTDHLGTPILQTGSDAGIVWRAEYEPYGSVYAYRAGDSTDPQVLRFPGQEFASELADTGVNDASYNIFRWYRAGWGRYTQADPLGLVASLNLYRYAQDNPIDMVDPDGLRACTNEQEKSCRRGCGEMGKRFKSCEAFTTDVCFAEIDWVACKCERSKCPPCPLKMPRVDFVPPSKPHWPCQGNHLHYWTSNQNSETCACNYKEHIVCLQSPNPFR
jgi:RHS repeat-associated protein